MMPVDGYFSEASNMHMSDEMRQTILRNMGLLEPPLIQLFNFFKEFFLHGTLGNSMRSYVGIPVLEVIFQKMPISIAFGASALVISIVLGVMLGVVMAKNKGKLQDVLGNAYIVVVSAVPAMVYYYLILLYGTKWLNIPSMMFKPKIPSTWFLPVLSLALGEIAGYAIWIRRYMVDELNKDYIKLARAKGLPSKKIMYKHILRNAMIPMAQNLPAAFIGVISGTTFLERLYVIPGTGQLLVNAINQSDNTLVQALILIYSAASVFGVFLGDILLVAIDPRISLTNEKGGGR